MKDPIGERPCLLCDGRDFMTVHRGPDHSKTASGEFSLDQCRDCGLISLRPFPALDEIEGFYGKDYPVHRLTALNQLSRLRRFYRGWGLDRLCRLVVRFSGLSGGRLLDIGTAGGDFLFRMQQWGIWQLFGVELNRQAAGFAREARGLNVFSGTLLEAGFPKHSFHVVTLWNVLEHLPDPRKTLEVIHRLLVPGGSLLMSLPYMESFEARRFGRHWAGWEVPRHLFLFPWRTLHRLLEVSGFEIKGKCFPYAGFGPLAASLELVLNSYLPESARRAKLIQWSGGPLVHFFALPYLYTLQFSGSSSLVAVLAKRKP